MGNVSEFDMEKYFSYRLMYLHSPMACENTLAFSQNAIE